MQIVDIICNAYESNGVRTKINNKLYYDYDDGTSYGQMLRIDGTYIFVKTEKSILRVSIFENVRKYNDGYQIVDCRIFS